VRIEEYQPTNMKRYLVLMLLIQLIQICCCEVKPLRKQKTLSRKKRYLSFPNGSSAVVSVLLSHVFQNQVNEYDVVTFKYT